MGVLVSNIKLVGLSHGGFISSIYRNDIDAERDNF